MCFALPLWFRQNGKRFPGTAHITARRGLEDDPKLSSGPQCFPTSQARASRPWVCCKHFSKCSPASPLGEPGSRYLGPGSSVTHLNAAASAHATAWKGPDVQIQTSSYKWCLSFLLRSLFCLLSKYFLWKIHVYVTSDSRAERENFFTGFLLCCMLVILNW